MKALVLCLSGLALAGAAAERDPLVATFRVPVLGYVAAPDSPEVRAVLGLPATARWSAPLVLPEGIANVRVAPGQGYALVDAAGDLAVLRFTGLAAGTPLKIEGAMPDAGMVAFSASGRVAVLSSRRTGRLQVVKGLPANPEVAWEGFAVTRALAVTDDATAVASAGSNTVLLLQAGVAPRQLLDGAASALAFLPAGDDLVAMHDTDAVLVQAARGRAAVRVLATHSSFAEAVAVSAAEGAIFVAAGARLVTIDLESGATASVEVPGASAFAAMRFRGSFLATGAGATVVTQQPDRTLAEWSIRDAVH